MRLDSHLRRCGYTNRSEAFRDMARKILAEERLKNPNAESVAVLSIVYDHHRLELPERLTDLQHRHLDRILCSLHVHLDRHHCLEVIVLRGKAGKLQEIGDMLIGLNGVKFGRLALVVPRDLLP